MDNHKKIWNAIKSIKGNKQLFFVHTPKTGGTYAKKIMKKMNIIGNNMPIDPHIQATETDNKNHIVFTIIREPVSRFESLLYFRDKHPIIGISKTAEDRKSMKDYIDINEFVDNQTDELLTSFAPYRTLCYWSKNVDIFITIDQLKPFLEFFGHNVPSSDYKVNSTDKKYGRFNDKTKKRIAKLYKEDVEFYQEKTS